MLSAIIIVILSLLLIVSVMYSVFLKKDISSIEQSLREICQKETNKTIETDTFDRDIVKLAVSINKILEKQKELRRGIEKSNNELRKAITNISHDLRTPLTSVRGYIQMINSGKVTIEKQAEYAGIIESRLKALSNLMDELFEFAQITEGKNLINVECVNICNPLADVISTFYDDFTARGIVPEIVIPKSPVYAFCDTGALNRIMQNLIRNALIHGSGNVRISVEPLNSSIIFENSVKDIESLEVERLFERFYTSDGSRSGKSSGLGLAIVKELAEQMGGKIEANTKSERLIIQLRLETYAK